MRNEPNAQYNLARPESLSVRVAGRMRRRMYECFIEQAQVSPTDTILDVGATSDQSYESSNYLEAWYPLKGQLTAVGLDDASFLEQIYPGMRYVRADGKDLPFEASSYDVVHSSAVIEHVGSRDEQVRFVGELLRVSRRVVCLTTPNRWFPIEVHTGLPLIHWLPPDTFRVALHRFGLPFFADERNLNLLGRGDLIRICECLTPRRLECRPMRLGGWTSNLMIFLWK